MSTWFKSFIDSLERLIEKPPYLLFFFVGAVFIVVSLISKYNFEKMWVFFLYSVVGIIWRYAEKDIMKPLIEKLSDKKLTDKKYSSSELWIRILYHIGNLVLLIALLKYQGMV
jgi:hypothetical protein